jgi:hypothetical protein
MVEISPPRSLSPDQVVVVGGNKQQLHSTTTTITLLRRCHCSHWHRRAIPSYQLDSILTSYFVRC